MRPKTIRVYPKYLSLLMLAYTMCLVLSNWVDARLIQIGPIIGDGGILIYSLTFFFANVITEVYGYKYARQLIWCGFFFNAVFIFYGLIITSLPSPAFAINNDVFDRILLVNFRVFTAAAVSYLLSETTNIILQAKWKIKTQGKFMWQRFLGATFIGICIDASIFTLIAFFGTMLSHHLIFLVLNIWMIKFITVVIFTPLFTRLARKLKTLEQTDIYDVGTKFNLFSLDTEYGVEANRYK